MSYCHLSSEERYVISYLVLADLSLRGLDNRSRMNREIHVRICEGLRGKFPRPTRLWILITLLISHADFHNI
jgi:hypothetical protein